MSWGNNLLVTLDINNFSRDTKRKASLTFSLVTTFIIIISSLSFLININTMENVVATIASRNTTITATPPTIEAQSPVDAKTGQEIVLPPEKLLETNPVTGQAEVIGDVIIKDPVIRGGSLQQVTNEDGNEAFIDEGLKGSNDIIRGDAFVGDQTVDVLGDGGFLNLESEVKFEGGKMLIRDSTGQPAIIEFTLSDILNETNDIVYWYPFDSVIAVKVERIGSDANLKDPVIVLIKAFRSNQYSTLTAWSLDGKSELYHFVHIPSNEWEAPAIPINIVLQNAVGERIDANYTKSPMCNTYIELGKLYKCNIIIE